MAATRPPTRPARRAPAPRRGIRLRLLWTSKRWVRYLFLTAALFTVVSAGVAVFFWISFAHLIDSKLTGEERPVPRIFGRPFEVLPGQGVSPAQLAQRLNDVGYAERPKVEGPGEFSVGPTHIIIVPRTQNGKNSQTVRVDFSKSASPAVTRISVVGGAPLDRLVLEAPLLAAIAPGEKRRFVPLRSIPPHMINAVLAIEDRRFFDHPGVDPIGAIGALITNLRGNKAYLAGGSTLTQQIVKNTFLTRDQTMRRKLQEQFMAVVLESRFTKQQILELYLNDQVFGQRGPFEIRGVGEASRIFFGKDVSNVSLAEAATLAGVLQSPSRLSPFRNADRAQERRNVVLKEMADHGLASPSDAAKAAAEPLGVSMRALENEAPYFVDYVSQLVEEQYAGLFKKDTAVDVYTTLDLHLQRLAQEAVADGIAAVDKLLASKKRTGKPQVALVAVDPRTGGIVAMVGGRAYNESQYNRAVTSKRQPGSTFKPFVYLTAFDRMGTEGRADFTPATIVTDEPTTFKDGENDYAPGNYQNEYDGPITLRRALAHSRNIVAIKVAEAVGFDNVANLWKRTGVGPLAKPYPSIALGVFEASALDMAEAYTLFTNGGSVKPLRAITTIVEDTKPRQEAAGKLRPVARADATFLVVNMMRSVIDEGTGAGARRDGFTLDAAGKSGTTNDQRDAWFVGFTPELLTVVWVGYDNNQPIGLTGSQAALPIWTRFMKRALANHPSLPFPAPEGITYADIDKETGQLATANCPTHFREAFLSGTEPHTMCETHGGNPAVRLLDRIQGFFRGIIR